MHEQRGAIAKATATRSAPTDLETRRVTAVAPWPFLLSRERRWLVRGRQAVRHLAIGVIAKRPVGQYGAVVLPRRIDPDQLTRRPQR